MKMVRSRLLVCSVLAAVALVFSPVAVQADTWADGSAADFSYANGQDINGYFGEPMVLGNQMIFFGASFVADAAAGDYEDSSDTVSFDITVTTPGYQLSWVTVTALGNYSIGANGDGSYVNASADLVITENTPTPDSFNQGMLFSFNPTIGPDPLDFPVESTGDALAGTWSGIVELDVSYVLGLSSNLHVEMSNLLEASAVAGSGGAEVDQLYQDIVFEFGFIPEPATLTLLGLGGLVLLRRRR